MLGGVFHSYKEKVVHGMIIIGKIKEKEFIQAQAYKKLYPFMKNLHLLYTIISYQKNMMIWGNN